MANTGEFDWTAAGPASDSVVFKVVARNPGGLASHVTSPALLHVEGLAAVTPGGVPRRLALTRIMPNPAARQIEFRIAVPSAGRVTLRLYDQQGRLAATVLDAWRAAGEARVS